MRQLIILGNGFDINCELKSKYEDFFLSRFSELLNHQYSILEDLKSPLNKKTMEIISDIWDETNPRDYFSLYSKKWFGDTDAELNRWDIIFMFAKLCIDEEVSQCNWEDVESIIYEVVSIALNDGVGKNSKIKYKEKVENGNGQSDGKEAFYKLVRSISFVKADKLTKSVIAAELLSELKKFEAIFSRYISDQIDLDHPKEGYVKKAIDLYKAISKYSNRSKTNSIDTVDVLSFNYSLDEKFQDIIDREIDDYRLKSWSNIHGIAHYKETPYYPAPIFGIDNHNISANGEEMDYRIPFTKLYRVLEGHINDIRGSKSYKNTDLISIFGHSLGEADYSYFESIFDENELYRSNCKIEYYYWPGNSGDEGSKLIQRQRNATNLYNLLINYGETLDKKYGKNIVTKLNIENRISLIPTSEITK